MHDATEGGLLGALYELAMASGVGFEIDLASVPIREETRLICHAAGVDPLRLMSSGSMIIATRDPEGAVDRIQSQGVRATVIGRITTERTGCVVDRGNRVPVGPPEADQLYLGLANLR